MEEGGGIAPGKFPSSTHRAAGRLDAAQIGESMARQLVVAGRPVSGRASGFGARAAMASRSRRKDETSVGRILHPSRTPAPVWSLSRRPREA